MITISHYAATCAKYGMDAVAISSPDGTYTSWDVLTNKTNPQTIDAVLYAELSVKLYWELKYGGLFGLNAIFPKSLPAGTYLSANYGGSPPNCTVENTKFVFTRLTVPTTEQLNQDVYHCGSRTLPHERLIIPGLEGCWATVSLANMTNNGDVPAAQQAVAVERLQNILTCPPESVYSGY